MMIDFALEAERDQGKSPLEAIHEACLLRFRPIMMTTFAAIGGGLPLALGQGAGSELRRPLGIAIVGGLLVSQWLTLYTTPVIYLYLDRFAHWLSGKRGRRPARFRRPCRPRITFRRGRRARRRLERFPCRWNRARTAVPCPSPGRGSRCAHGRYLLRQAYSAADSGRTEYVLRGAMASRYEAKSTWSRMRRA